MSNFVDLFNEESIKDKIVNKIDEKKKEKEDKKKKKYKKKVYCKKSNDECGSACKESFHFGPTFNSNYLEYALSEGEDCSSCATGECDDGYDDPTEPSIDDIVNAEPDMAANYHFGPAFGQDIFTKSTLKHSRK